jgi:hypothetical protein
MRGLVEVVGGQQHRRAGVAQFLDQGPELPARGRVETRGRLVEEQQLRLALDAESHLQPPALPPGEPVHPGVRRPGQTHRVDQLGAVADQSVVVRVVSDRLGHGERVAGARSLTHHADPVPPPAAGDRGILAQHRHLTGVPAA